MILIVDPHSGIPVYRQIVDQIRFHVTSGVLEPEAELPSTRALSARLGVNPLTISKAFGLLEEDGLLERRPGLPHAVRAQAGEAARASRLEQLERALRPVTVKVRQLDLDTDSAVELFRRLIEEEER